MATLYANSDIAATVRRGLAAAKDRPNPGGRPMHGGEIRPPGPGVPPQSLEALAGRRGLAPSLQQGVGSGGGNGEGN